MANILFDQISACRIVSIYNIGIAVIQFYESAFLVERFFRYHKITVIEVRHYYKCVENELNEKCKCHRMESMERRHTPKKGKFTIGKEKNVCFVVNACKGYIEKRVCLNPKIARVACNVFLIQRKFLEINGKISSTYLQLLLNKLISKCLDGSFIFTFNLCFVVSKY